MHEKAISHVKGANPDSPYSMAVIYGSLLFVSGQIPLDPATNTVISESFAEEVEMALQNLKIVLEEAGSSMDKVLKTTVFLSSMEHFADFNEIYKCNFVEDRPARSCIEASGLPFDARVEIEAIAAV